jgi:AraC-like DNA-binding protein
MTKTKILKVKKLPFLELRYLSHVTSCDKAHKHNELTITAIKSGCINILFDDKEDSLKQGRLSVVDPGIVHSASLSGIDSSGCYVMYLDKEWCVRIQRSLYENLNSYLHLHVTLVQDEKLYNGFIKMCDELFVKDMPLLEKEEKTLEFISDIFLNYCDAACQNKIYKRTSKYIKTVEKYIDENFLEDIMLEDIALHVNISIVHLLRLFKEELSMSVHAYILNKKVHFAKELLSQNIPIAEAAQMSGFFDQSHLNRSFKRVFQLTPKEYQKNIFS